MGCKSGRQRTFSLPPRFVRGACGRRNPSASPAQLPLLFPKDVMFFWPFPVAEFLPRSGSRVRLWFLTPGAALGPWVQTSGQASLAHGPRRGSTGSCAPMLAGAVVPMRVAADSPPPARGKSGSLRGPGDARPFLKAPSGEGLPGSHHSQLLRTSQAGSSLPTLCLCCAWRPSAAAAGSVSPSAVPKAGSE